MFSLVSRSKLLEDPTSKAFGKNVVPTSDGCACNMSFVLIALEDS